MRSPLSEVLRRAAAGFLPEGAFLRRDRGQALYASDAPRRCPGADWVAEANRAGFLGEVRDGLLLLTPGAAWLERVEAAFPAPPGPFCEGLARFRGLPPEPESLRLFALGARALDAGTPDPRFDRLLRQRAAACLRLNAMEPTRAPRGGGLYACALLGEILKEEKV